MLELYDKSSYVLTCLPIIPTPSTPSQCLPTSTPSQHYRPRQQTPAQTLWFQAKNPANTAIVAYKQGPMNGQGCFYECNPAWHSQPNIPPRQLEHAGGKGPPQDAGTKWRSTPSASLVTSPTSTSLESLSSLEPRLCLLLKPKLLKSPVFDSKDDIHQHIIAAIQKGSEGPEHEVFSDVSEKDYDYILDAIQFDDHLIRKPSYIPCIQQLSVNLPTPVHESILAPLRTTMGAIMSSLPLPSALNTTLRVHMNTMVEKAEDNKDKEDRHNLGIPDMLIQHKSRDTEFHPLWPFELSFSQSLEAVESKIQYFADKNPHIEGGTHFHIAEVEKHVLPSDEWVIEQELDKKKVGRIREVGRTAGGDGILSCSHIWLHPLEVTITTWLCPPDGQLNIANHSLQLYATAVLFPQQDVAGLRNVQCLLKRTLQRVRDSTVRHLDKEHPPGSNDPLIPLIKTLKQWTIPTTVVDWDTCVDGLETAAKQTGYRRYRKWHKNFLKRTINEVEDADYVPPASTNKRGRRN